MKYLLITSNPDRIFRFSISEVISIFNSSINKEKQIQPTKNCNGTFIVRDSFFGTGLTVISRLIIGYASCIVDFFEGLWRVINSPEESAAIFEAGIAKSN